MGGLVGGLFDLFSGDPTKGEQNKLGSLGGYETGVGEGLTTAGANFDESILSGDQGKIATALAPEISAGQKQVEQQRNMDAQFGGRSGGTAASTANAETAERGNIINLVGGLQQGTAGQALSAGSGLLGQASGNIQSQADLAAKNQQRVTGDVGGIAQGAAEIATGFADPAAASGDPFQTLYNAQHPDTSGISTESPNLDGIGVA
jgi:hypothetical protein